jgi:hypothetical protein
MNIQTIDNVAVIVLTTRELNGIRLDLNDLDEARMELPTMELRNELNNRHELERVS